MKLLHVHIHDANSLNYKKKKRQLQAEISKFMKSNFYLGCF